MRATVQVQKSNLPNRHSQLTCDAWQGPKRQPSAATVLGLSGGAVPSRQRAGSNVEIWENTSQREGGGIGALRHSTLAD